MAESTLEEILDKILELLAETLEGLKRALGIETRRMLADNSGTKGFKPAIWTPPKTNEDTTDADLDALSVAGLDTWATQNKVYVEELMGDM